MGHLEGGLAFLPKPPKAKRVGGFLLPPLLWNAFMCSTVPIRNPLMRPDFLEKAPVNFMNGQVLHYSLSSDGHFLLYSVGLDCQNNGGEMAQDKGSGRGLAS